MCQICSNRALMGEGVGDWKARSTHRLKKNTHPCLSGKEISDGCVGWMRCGLKDTKSYVKLDTSSTTLSSMLYLIRIFDNVPFGL